VLRTARVIVPSLSPNPVLADKPAGSACAAGPAPDAEPIGTDESRAVRGGRGHGPTRGHARDPDPSRNFARG
jgi:hypothetical protein